MNQNPVISIFDNIWKRYLLYKKFSQKNIEQIIVSIKQTLTRKSWDKIWTMMKFT